MCFEAEDDVVQLYHGVILQIVEIFSSWTGEFTDFVANIMRL